ncbi:MAG TPA: LamG domain-containing protein [Gammaproteobacteria bacterium]
MNKKLITLLLMLSGFTAEAMAATCTSRQDGLWDNSSTWTCTDGRNWPRSDDTVIIRSGDTVRLDDDRAATNLTIEAGGTLDDRGNDLTISGSAVIDGTYDGSGNGELIMTGDGQTLSGNGTIIDIDRIRIDADITIPAGSNLSLTERSEIRVGRGSSATLTIDGTIDGSGQRDGNRILRVDNDNASTVIINGTIDAPASYLEIQRNGTVINNGDVTLRYLDGDDASSAVWTQGDNSSLTMTAPARKWSGTFNASAPGNTVTYDGSATPLTPSGNTYYNLDGTYFDSPGACPHGFTVLGSAPCDTAGGGAASTASGTCTSDPSNGGSYAWSGLNNVGASDNSYAQADGRSGSITEYLKCTGYSFNIPADAIVTGIELSIELHSESNRYFYDNFVHLVKNNTVQTAANKGTGTDLRGNSDMVLSYGAPTDLWGGSWTAAEINSASFGAAFAAQRGNYNNTGTVFVDTMPITVHYTLPSGSGPVPTAGYSMDEAAWDGTSGEVVDNIGTSNGTSFNGANTIDTGKICRAGSFDGVDDYVEVPNLSAKLNGTASLAFWINTTQTGNDTDWLAPGVTGVELSGGADDIFWGWLDASGHIGISVGNDNSSKSTTPVNDGTWHHVVLTRDATNGAYKIYIDGSLNKSGTSASGIIGTPFSSIGRIEDTGGSPEYLQGELDEVLIFDSVLSDAEVVAGYTNQAAGNNWDGSVRNCGGAGPPGPCQPIAPAGASTNSANSSSLSLNVPTGVNIGNLLIAQVAVRHSCILGIFCSNNITPPAGWTLIRENIAGGDLLGIGTTMTHGSYFRVVDGNEPGSYTWGFSNSNRAAGSISAFIGIDPDNPIDVHSGQAGSGTTIIAPSVTTTQDEEYLVALFANANGNGDITPTAMELLYRQKTSAGSNGVAIAAGGEAWPAASATNDRTASAQSATNIGQLIALRPEICAPSVPDHFRFEHDGGGVTCNPEDIAVRACMDADCNTEYPDPIDATLAPTGWVGGDTQTFTSGDTLQLWYKTAGTATLDIASIVGAANPARCFVGGVEQPSCDMPFYDSGFLFDVPHHAAASLQTVTLAAVRTDLTTQQCVPTFQGVTKEVNFWSTYNNPNNVTQAVSVNGTDVATASPGTALNLAFDANGETVLSVSYPDAGSMLLDAQYTGTGEEAGLVMVGQDSFTARPARFRVTITGNPEAADAAGAPFMKAGEAFPVTLEALNSNGALTPNFGNESTPESALLGAPGWVAGTGYAAGAYVVPTTFTGFTYEAVTGGTSAATEPSWPVSNGETITDGTVTWKAHSGYMPNLISPAAGVNKPLTQSFTFNNGSATGTVSWPEVGVIQLTPHILDGDYLGAGDVLGTTTPNVGRFYPDHFTTAVSNGVFANGCPTCPTPFTYLGQSFSYATAPTVTATANAVGGLVTENYTGSYARLGTGGVTLSYPIVDNSPLVNIAVDVIDTSLGRSDNGDGSLTFTLAGGATADTYTYDRSLGEVAPFTADLTIELTNLSDGEADATDLVTAKAITPLGNLQRYGRAVLGDAYGAVGATLPMPLGLQYYDGMNFINHADDVNTAFNSSFLGCVDPYLGVAPGCGDSSVVGATVGNGGSFEISAGMAGTLNFVLDISAAAADYLQYDWDADGTQDNPSATATFGVYRGDDRFLYWREAERP